MIKRFLFCLFAALALTSFAQAPVITSVSGPSLICWAPNTSQVYSAVASNSPFQYSWNVQPSAGVFGVSVGANQMSFTFPNADGVYTLSCMAMNGSGSSAPYTYVVVVRERPTIQFSGNFFLCQGSSTNLQGSPTVSSDNTPLLYSWTPPTGLNVTNGPVVVASPTVTTTYTINVVNGACQYTVPLTVSVFSPLLLSFSGPTLICQGASATFSMSASPNQGTSTLFYSWAPAFGLNTTSGPVVDASPGVSTVYTVSANNSVCYSSATIALTVDACTSIQESASAREVLVYPNPSSGLLFIRSALPLEGDLIDELGRVLRHLVFVPGEPIELQGLQSGLYFVVTPHSRLKIVVNR